MEKYKQFYDLSCSCIRLLELFGRKLVGFQLFRYRMIVDSSSRGIDCPYAIGCYRLSYGEINEIREVIGAIKLQVKLLDEKFEEFYKTWSLDESID